MGDMQKYLGALKPRTGHTQGLLLFYDRLGFPQLIAKISCLQTKIARKIRPFIVGTTFFAILTQRCIITHHGRPVCRATVAARVYWSAEDYGLNESGPRDLKAKRTVHRIFHACLGEYIDESETA
jgi:hypothetical protein